MTNSPAKMAEPIVMPFRMMTQVGPRNYVFDWGPEPHTRRRNFEGEKELAQDKVTQQGQNWHAADAHWGVLHCDS